MTSQSSNPDRQVPTRRISFEESLRDLPKHYAIGGDLILSHLAASLSAVFPDGEEFFVRSVRHFRDQITDPGQTSDETSNRCGGAAESSRAYSGPQRARGRIPAYHHA